MRTLSFENNFDVIEIANELLSAGYGEGDTIGDLLHQRVGDADISVALDCVIGEDEALEELGDEAIIKAFNDLGVEDGADREVEDAIRYVRAGDLSLARVMFGRVFEGGNLLAAERALS